MTFRRICSGALLLLVALVQTLALANPVPKIGDPVFGCEQRAPDVDFYPRTADPQQWARFIQRDNANQACAAQRWEDQFHNDELHRRFLDLTGQRFPSQVQRSTDEPDRLTINQSQQVPGGNIGDPFRDPLEWVNDGRGRNVPVTFIARRTGARLAGDLWLPPSSLPGPYPGVVIAPGASQQYRQLYMWAAQGLAEEGYQVLTFDFQAQGGSENANHNPDGSLCVNVGCAGDLGPSDQQTDARFFYDGMRDAIAFFFSTPSTPYGTDSPNHAETNVFNPGWDSLDREKVGVAGHSVGAVVANDIGQQDQRIKAIVRWGYTGFINLPFLPYAHAPTLIVGDEYGPKGPQPWFTLPEQRHQEYGYNQIREQGLPAMLVSLRSSTHFEWTWAAGRYASRYGERVSFYFALAWFDAYLKGLTDDSKRADAFARLTALRFDDSADRHSIGAGVYTRDPETGTYYNQPYMIGFRCVSDHLSYIYRSRYWLQGGARVSDDMRSLKCPE